MHATEASKKVRTAHETLLSRLKKWEEEVRHLKEVMCLVEAAVNDMVDGFKNEDVNTIRGRAAKYDEYAPELEHLFKRMSFEVSGQHVPQGLRTRCESLLTGVGRVRRRALDEAIDHHEWQEYVARVRRLVIRLYGALGTSGGDEELCRREPGSASVAQGGV